MAPAAAPPPPSAGGPSTGARERILVAATETMKAEGYAGLTVAKVAARAGESKALIGYHFGSKQGLVAAVGRQLAETITSRVLAEIEDAATVEDLTRGVAVAIEEIAAEDPRIPRLYFDLAAVSVVDPDVRETIQEINGVWRGVLHRAPRGGLRRPQAPRRPGRGAADHGRRPGDGPREGRARARARAEAGPRAVRAARSPSPQALSPRPERPRPLTAPLRAAASIPRPTRSP